MPWRALVDNQKEAAVRVLLIEPDVATAQSVELVLKSEGMNVYTTDLGEEGIDLSRLYDYDIILLELNLPDMSGCQFISKLRTGQIQTPIIVVTGLTGIEDEVRSLGLGADDYITKPFHKERLLARIYAVTRRMKGCAVSSITAGDLVVNLSTKTVTIRGNRLRLTGKEYQIIELLVMRKDSIITKDVLLGHLYGGMDEPELKIIDVFICKLRKKLAAHADGANYIETVWGRGYKIAENSTTAEEAATA